MRKTQDGRCPNCENKIYALNRNYQNWREMRHLTVERMLVQCSICTTYLLVTLREAVRYGGDISDRLPVLHEVQCSTEAWRGGQLAFPTPDFLAVQDEKVRKLAVVAKTIVPEAHTVFGKISEHLRPSTLRSTTALVLKITLVGGWLGDRIENPMTLSSAINLLTPAERNTIIDFHKLVSEASELFFQDMIFEALINQFDNMLLPWINGVQTVYVPAHDVSATFESLGLSPIKRPLQVNWISYA